MALFDYSDPKQNEPYYSDVTMDPRYIALLKEIKQKQAINEGIGTTFTVLSSLFGGPLGSKAGGLIGKAISNSGKQGFADQLASIKSGPQHTTQTSGLPGVDMDGTKLSSLAKLFKANNSTPNFMSKGFTAPPSDYFDTTQGADTSLEQAPAVGDAATSTPIDVTGGGGMDWTGGGLGGFGGGVSGGLGMFKGGNIVVGDDGIKLMEDGGYVDGGAVKVTGGKGKDDIALVDTNTGKDTGVRVQKGEMLVFSEDTLAALHKAIEKKDKNKAFKLISDQMKQKPDGNKFQAGGVANTDIDVDKELANVDAKIAEIQKQKDDKNKTQAEKDKSQQLLVELKYWKGELEDAGKKYKGVKESSLLSEEAKLSKQKEFLNKMKEAKSKIDNFDVQGPKSASDIPEGTTFEYKRRVGTKSDIGGEDPNNRILTFKNGKWVVPGAGSFEPGTPTHKEITDAYLEQQQKISQKPDWEGGAATMPEDISAISKIARPAGQTPVTPKIDGLAAFKQHATPDPTDPFADQGRADIPYTEPGALPQATDYATIINQPETTSTKQPFDTKGLFENLAGTGFDIARGIAGWNAANQPLPTFNKSPQWIDFLNKLKTNAQGGLSAQEMAALQRQVGQGYAYDVANIRNVSGGNAGQVLGNLGRAAGQYYGNENQIAAMDRNAHLQNLQLYGSYLPTDINLDRMKFSDKYQEGLWNKQAGAQLTNDAIKNMQERWTTNKEYGPGSWYEKLNQAQLDQMGETTDELKGLKDYYSKYGFTSGAVGSTASSAKPSFQTYLDYLNTIK